MSLDNEYPLPISSQDNDRKSFNLLPRFYRTDTNKKFLSSTVDQLIQPGTVKKVSSFVGRQDAKSVKNTDVFIESPEKNRQDYQLEPAAVIEDRFGNVDFFKDYIDYINHINLLDGDTTNHQRLSEQEFYSWNPHIDWDKFANFQQYYWLPYGPDPIPIIGQQLEIDSTFTVVLEDQGDVFAYLFTPDGLTRNPRLVLYRGQTYRFTIQSTDHPFSIKTSRVKGFDNRYTNDTDIVSQNSVENGTVIFNIPFNAPDVLYYVSEQDPNVGGQFIIKDIEENTFLNVQKELLGKKTYTLPSGMSLSNGMKLEFTGKTEPEIYQTGYWLVDGVGDAITLINSRELEIIASYTEEKNLLFDNDPFDQVPFSTQTSIPKSKDYIVIKRTSKDRNPWSRTNRWFHQNIIIETAKQRGSVADLDQTQRAIRPIIEFDANLKLHNFGHINKPNVDLIDNFTTDVFSTIEGSLGYNIDGIDLTDGMRVLFTADTDRLVNGKIYKVRFINITLTSRRIDFQAEPPSDSTGGVFIETDTIKSYTPHGLINGDKVVYLSNNNVELQLLKHRQVYYVKVIDAYSIQLYIDPELLKVADILAIGSGTHSLEILVGLRRQISLEPTEDSDPKIYETVLVNSGINEVINYNGNTVIGNQGLMYWYNGTKWILGQNKFDKNQSPLFDIFDEYGYSYSDVDVYSGSSFLGTKLFSYKLGEGSADLELGLSLSYRNISNIGDIVFNFDLLNDSFFYKSGTTVLQKNTDKGFLRKIDSTENWHYENGWIKSQVKNFQPIVRIYKNSSIDGVTTGFPIDVFDDQLDLSDLVVKVYINGNRLSNYHFKVEQGVVRKAVFLASPVKETDIVTLKCYSRQPKNQNGYYELPINFQNNPQNNNLNSFTLGEVIDHVSSIIDNLPDPLMFKGDYPGNGNLRDLSNLSAFGIRFVQHTSLINLALHALGSKDFNLFNSLELAKNDYGKFKTTFLITASEIGVHTEPKQLVDLILYEMNKDKPKTDAWFLSDMFGYTGNLKFVYTVLDPRTKNYPLKNSFNLENLSNKSVLIYLNNIQLVHGKDYNFLGDFFEILTDLAEDDQIEVYEYETTDGSFCPPTPTKLGLYPLYEPRKYIDDTYLIPRTVIQGHDGSITIGFEDYRDDVLLELEKRIFNNIKIKYDPDIFDIWDYIPGHNRATSYLKSEQDVILSKFFYQWTSKIQNDYTKSNGDWDLLNAFTYNFRGYNLADNTSSLAFWRGIYRWVLDTDRPHTHPWECLGFSIEPIWWKEVYGPHPYTSDNFMLWDDIKDGIIREPGKSVKVRSKFAKPILQYGKPVDGSGSLLDPIQSNFVKGLINPIDDGYFIFGDQGPVETAWRRSSYYAFSLLESAILMNPARVISLCFDRSRIVRNIVNQLVYKPTGLRIRLKDIVLPSVVTTEIRSYTSGLINYVVNNFDVGLSNPIEKYKFQLENLNNKISYRLSGFTSKEKLRVILTSKNPSSTSGVFLPDENFKIFLNSSSPIKELNYSGVLITKTDSGFEVRGYDKKRPYFKYYLISGPGKNYNIGGISEIYVEWVSNQRFLVGQIVYYSSYYYRVVATHTTEDLFNESLYVKLSSLPVIGGRDILISKDFDTRIEYTLSYGTVFYTIQEVVDFILGYGKYLELEGFVFDEYNNNLKSVESWETSVKEFAFWTTQNWKSGSVISLSPMANKIIYKNQFSVVDDIRDLFYGYNIFRVDGELLDDSFVNSYRDNNEFNIKVINSNHGIYGAKFRLVQKEHVLLLDNVSLFNDVIYDLEAGYKQDKLKIQGYVTTGWNGKFNIPGFIYDEAKIKDWESWTDYNLGDIVFYKDFYYSANRFLPGTDLLNFTDWTKLDSKPKSRLIPNWDYKAEQFADFYDLDSDNFDVEQQKLAQHLIGYQKRRYLENIINDDISQYKFYQGMILDKGTSNVLNKLFDVLSAEDKESLTFDEEWGLRVGTYGNTATFDELEIKLDESKIKLNPQPLEFTELSVIQPDFVYRVKQSEIYIKPQGFKENLWPLTIKPDYLRSPGHVRYSDVKLSVDDIEDILDEDITDFEEGDYVWTAFLNSAKQWSVYRLTSTGIRVESISYKSEVLTLVFTELSDLVTGQVIGIANIDKISGFYKVDSILGKTLKIRTKVEEWEDDLKSDSTQTLIYKFTESRVTNVDDVNDYLPKKIKNNELIWVDNNGFEKKSVLTYSKVYSKNYIDNLNLKSNNMLFGKSVIINKTGMISAVSYNNGINIYFKNTKDYTFAQQQVINSFYPNSSKFADSMAISSDGEFLAFLEIRLDNSSNVHIYRKDSPLGTFQYFQTITKLNSSFGLVIRLGFDNTNYFALISSSDTIYSYKLVNSSFAEIQQMATSVTLFETNSLSSVLVSSSIDLSGDATRGDSVVKIFKRDDDQFSLLQTINGVSFFGSSIAVSDTGSTLAFGMSEYDGSTINSGLVKIYKKNNNNLYNFIQDIRSKNPDTYDYFGYNVSFMNNDQTLVVLSLNGDVDSISTFDEETTFFDNNTLRYLDKRVNSGRIEIFDRYANNYIFGESLDTDSTTNFSDGYGYSVAVGADTILVSSVYEEIDNFTDVGKVFSYTKVPNKLSWSEKYIQADNVDIKKIKKVYIYDTEENKLLSYIDIVNVNQGKIPGPADQEIRFKTYYDPATYNVGTSDVIVDDGQAWNKQHVGMLWWDLTKAKFVDNLMGNITYKSANWNKLYKTASIDIYEWVETKYKPSEWDVLSGTEKGDSLGISGVSKYGNDCYSIRRYFDSTSQTFKNTYYFWVKNPAIIPNILDRKLSANDVSKLIADPISYNYPCISFIDNNSFILVNLTNYVRSNKSNINIEYYLVDEQYTDTNTHSQWKLFSLNENTIIPKEIETKWIDSLIGVDNQNRLVPNLKLPIKKRYGVNNRPRQSMFINRVEALKQVIERTNNLLKNYVITDTVDISDLNLRDEAPTKSSGLWDKSISILEEQRFINTSLLAQAVLLAIVKDGSINEIKIVNSGYGYVNSPYVKIMGSGIGAKLRCNLNDLGQVISVDILNKGSGYRDDTVLKVRNFTILVESDSTVFDIWSLYEYNSSSNKFIRLQSQSFDVSRYWYYIDWYAEGYNQYVKIDYIVESTFELYRSTVAVGQIVKVENIGTGGWVLLERYADTLDFDYTKNYKVIGRQNGTIQFYKGLYDFTENIIGFDGNLFDSFYYDNMPVKELRIILGVIKNNLFIDDLYKEYLNLFYSSLRYILYEQPFVDWITKTSFVKAKHNLGELAQKVTYKNDSLENFEDYIKEVKPFRTKIREYVSSYSKIENTSSIITDFDFPSLYNINPSADSLTFNFNTSLGCKVVDLLIADGGSGYLFNPIVRINGDSVRPAVAKAYISGGRVNRIQIIDNGSGYKKAPEVIIDGGLSDEGSVAKVVPIIESEVVRANKMSLKFDRTTRTNNYTSLNVIQNEFRGTGSKVQFVLKYAPVLSKDSYSVTINGLDILIDDYFLSIKSTTTRGYTSYYGILNFETPPARGDIIVINYRINFLHLNALDRIYNYYSPVIGMIGNDFSQLMTGIDYGGVDIQGLVNFSGTGGWDDLGWGNELWDEINEGFEDQIFSYSPSNNYSLNYVPVLGQQINVYVNNVRIDDPNYGTSNPITNTNAVMATIVGNGTTSTYSLPISQLNLANTDSIIFRKSSSDGSISPKPQDYDTQLIGGSFGITGLNPEDIIVDGDGLITPDTSYAPEEVVPGHVIDTVSVKVFQLPSGNSAKILFKTIIADGSTNSFQINQIPQNSNSIIVKVNSTIVDRSAYVFDWSNRTVVFNSSPIENSNVTIISLGYSSQQLLDQDYFVADGSTKEFITAAPYFENNGVVVLVNGESSLYSIFETDSDYTTISRVGIRFFEPPEDGALINYIVNSDSNNTASIVKSQEILGDGSTTTYSLAHNLGENLPYDTNLLVIVDGQILNPSLGEYFLLKDDILSYRLTRYEQVPYQIELDKISVYLNGKLLKRSVDYNIDITGIRIILRSNAYIENGILHVSNMVGEQYQIVNGQIVFTNPPVLNSRIEIISFYNHNVLDIIRTRESLTYTTALDIDTPDFYRYSSLQGGKLRLFKQVNIDDFVWIIKNNNLLTPGIDFYLDTSLDQVIFANYIQTSDILDVIIFNSHRVSEGYGFMQFKDMFNRVHYKRLNKSKSTRLAEDLYQFDTIIKVIDGSVLDFPRLSENIPGIIEINGERIEYFEKNGNELSRLRRGTLGTGVPYRHKKDYLVINIGYSETISYNEEQIIEKIVSDGSTSSFTLDEKFSPDQEIITKNDIDVFVGGYRLRKNSFSLFLQSNGHPYSPEGDSVIEADFTVSGQNVLTLTVVPGQNVEILVVKRVGRIWEESTTGSLEDSKSEQAKFIVSEKPFYPEFYR